MIVAATNLKNLQHHKQFFYNNNNHYLLLLSSSILLQLQKKNFIDTTIIERRNYFNTIRLLPLDFNIKLYINFNSNRFISKIYSQQKEKRTAKLKKNKCKNISTIREENFENNNNIEQSLHNNQNFIKKMAQVSTLASSEYIYTNDTPGESVINNISIGAYATKDF